MTELSRHLITHINKNFNVPNTATCASAVDTISKCCKLLDNHKNKFTTTETIWYTYHFHALQMITLKKKGRGGKRVPTCKRFSKEESHGVFDTHCTTAELLFVPTMERDAVLPSKNSHFLLLFTRASC
jgi:hypothetical protein